jgi:hypothetical protein
MAVSQLKYRGFELSSLIWKLYLTQAIKTQNRALYKEAFVTPGGATLTESVIRSLLNESSSVFLVHPRYMVTGHSEELCAHLISLHNERLVLHNLYLL